MPVLLTQDLRKEAGEKLISIVFTKHFAGKSEELYDGGESSAGFSEAAKLSLFESFLICLILFPFDYKTNANEIKSDKFIYLRTLRA